MLSLGIDGSNYVEDLILQDLLFYMVMPLILANCHLSGFGILFRKIN